MYVNVTGLVFLLSLHSIICGSSTDAVVCSGVVKGFNNSRACVQYGRVLSFVAGRAAKVGSILGIK